MKSWISPKFLTKRIKWPHQLAKNFPRSKSIMQWYWTTFLILFDLCLTWCREIYVFKTEDKRNSGPHVCSIFQTGLCTKIKRNGKGHGQGDLSKVGQAINSEWMGVTGKRDVTKLRWIGQRMNDSVFASWKTDFLKWRFQNQIHKLPVALKQKWYLAKKDSGIS